MNQFLSLSLSLSKVMVFSLVFSLNICNINGQCGYAPLSGFPLVSDVCQNFIGNNLIIKCQTFDTDSDFFDTQDSTVEQVLIEFYDNNDIFCNEDPISTIPFENTNGGNDFFCTDNTQTACPLAYCLDIKVFEKDTNCQIPYQGSVPGIVDTRLALFRDPFEDSLDDTTFCFSDEAGTSDTDKILLEYNTFEQENLKITFLDDVLVPTPSGIACDVNAALSTTSFLDVIPGCSSSNQAQISGIELSDEADLFATISICDPQTTFTPAPTEENENED